MAKTQVVCTNVFKNSDNKTVKAVFTQKWIELINQFEKSEGVCKHDNLQVYQSNIK